MKALIVLLLSAAGAAPSHARCTAEFRGLLSIGDARTLWVEHQPAAPDHPTLFLLNGLTYTTRDWDAYVAELKKLDPDLGVVRYDMRGMGPSAGHDVSDISLDNQTDDLLALTKRLNLPGPLVLGGFSYGGGLTIKMAAEHPDRFAQFIAMAPFLNYLPNLDKLIDDLITQHRWWRPWDWRSREELYDHYLRVLIFSTFPVAEPAMWRDWPYKLEHVYRMVKGARRWLASLMISRLPKRRVHLMFGELDELVTLEASRTFVAAIPDDVIGSILYLKNVRHKVPEAAAAVAARWTIRILNGEPRLFEGHTWSVDGLGSPRCDTIFKEAE